MIKRFFCAMLLICMLTPLGGCSEKKTSSTEFALNTVITVTAYGEKSTEATEAVFTEVKRIEGLLSCHMDSSDISRINALAAIEPVEVSDETISVLKRALEVSRLTKGAFDITVKPLSDLWNITAENPAVPSDEDIKTTLSNVGYENVIIDGNRVSLKKDGVKLDLGGAAKGYCADKAAEILKSYDVKNAILDFGGNIYTLGKNEQGRAWTIGLQSPGAKRGEHFATEELSGKTAVTSGSYERYFEKNGKIYHHIFDPKTGYSADSGLISVTVIGDNSFEADMLSTAIFVMGSDGFKEVADSFNYDKFITVDKYNNPRTYLK